MTHAALSDAATPANNTTPTRPARLWQRLAALIYDLVTVVAIVMVVGMLCQAATLGKLQQMGAGGGAPWWYPLLQFLMVAAYFVVSWLHGGQTLGMRPWRMYLYRNDGTRLDLRTALIRAAVVSLPLLLLTLGHVAPISTAFYAALAAWVVLFGASMFDRRRRSLHDIAAGTAIVQRAPACKPRRTEPG